MTKVICDVCGNTINLRTDFVVKILPYYTLENQHITFDVCNECIEHIKNYCKGDII